MKIFEKIKLALKSLILENYYKIINRFCLGRKIHVAGPVDYIYSLTTFPSRVDKVYLTIESLFNQNCNFQYKVVIYLSKLQFPGDKIPKSLSRLVDRGLTVRFVDGDIRSYKKLNYALIDYPTSSIITVDDDVFYPRWMLKNMIESSCKFPGDILYFRGSEIVCNDLGDFSKYVNFPLATRKSNHICCIPTGVSGVFYPPGSLHKDVVDIDKFMTLAPFADDLWYKIMSYLKGTRCRLISNKSIHFTPIMNTQSVSLRKNNHSENSCNNDSQLENIVSYYRIDRRVFTNK
ncbi:hypothetical protein [Vibrio splendidus]|uniref:hypothetical protein n=1 Tax=Vibrio splendidus TaxID=29497 RepID=UPI0007F96DB5|nr:hypothetical protein [Vibrio splendidus]OBT24226.1 hypothetical protein A9262_19650 [Vibrio splendidus]